MAKLVVKIARRQIAACCNDARQSGFRNWTYHQVWLFYQTWEIADDQMAEQAAIAWTCELFNVSYMDAEWIEIVEAVANREAPAAQSTNTGDFRGKPNPDGDPT